MGDGTYKAATAGRVPAEVDRFDRAMKTLTVGFNDARNRSCSPRTFPQSPPGPARVNKAQRHGGQSSEPGRVAPVHVRNGLAARCAADGVWCSGANRVDTTRLAGVFPCRSPVLLCPLHRRHLIRGHKGCDRTACREKRAEFLCPATMCPEDSQ